MAKISEFDEIRPYDDGEMLDAFNELMSDRQFKTLIRGMVPWLPYSLLRGILRVAFIGVKTPYDFQVRFMRHVVNYVVRTFSDGCEFRRDPSVTWDKRYIFLSNHRDIVLDSAILDYNLFRANSPTTCEIAIGDNLLIYPWIRILVRMNKSFIVRRSLQAREMLKSSVLMSRYIHFAVNEKGENIWIAQREGRAKDSSDNTQESVLKMLALGYEGTPLESIKDINIAPLTISYEYDPCDYLKAKEFQLKRDNPQYKKSRQDDLENMKMGIKGYKGKIVYTLAPCINRWIDELQGLSAPEFYKALATRLDKEIHAGYEIYPNNYIALDRLNNNRDFAAFYTKEDQVRFDKYLRGQLAKIDIPNKDEEYLMDKMLTMYANPLRNYLTATKAE